MLVLAGLTREEAEEALRSVRRRHPALAWSIESPPSTGAAGHALVVADEDAVGMEDVIVDERRRAVPQRHVVTEGTRAIAKLLSGLRPGEALGRDDDRLAELEQTIGRRLLSQMGFAFAFDGILCEEALPSSRGLALRGKLWLMNGSSQLEEPFEAELALDDAGQLGRFELRYGRPEAVVRAKLARGDDEWTAHGHRVRVCVDPEAPWAFEVSKTGDATGTEKT